MQNMIVTSLEARPWSVKSMSIRWREFEASSDCECETNLVWVHFLAFFFYLYMKMEEKSDACLFATGTAVWSICVQIHSSISIHPILSSLKSHSSLFPPSIFYGICIHLVIIKYIKRICQEHSKYIVNILCSHK